MTTNPPSLVDHVRHRRMRRCRRDWFRVRRVVSRFLALGVRNESVRSRRAPVGVEGSNP